MPKREVLRRQKDFDAAYNKGRMTGERDLVMFYRKNGREKSRVSFLASKKVGNSVERNRARRLMKEAFRLTGPEFSDSYDLVLVARKTITEVKTQDVMKQLKAALKKSGVIR